MVFRLGVGVDQVTGPRPDRTSLRLGDGTRLEADLVLGAVGSQPAHGWLGGSDLMHAAGVPVDQRCQAGEHIYVAGDLAAQAVGGGSGGYRRVEHRLNASEQGRCAAQNLLDRGSKLASSGYFWSDQGDLRLQAVGTISNASRFEVVSGDPEGDRFVLVSIADHTIEAVDGVERCAGPHPLAQAGRRDGGRRVAEGGPVTEAQGIDTEVARRVLGPIRRS